MAPSRCKIHAYEAPRVIVGRSIERKEGTVMARIGNGGELEWYPAGASPRSVGGG